MLPSIGKKSKSNIKQLKIDLNYFIQGNLILKTKKNIVKIIDILQ